MKRSRHVCDCSHRKDKVTEVWGGAGWYDRQNVVLENDKGLGRRWSYDSGRCHVRGVEGGPFEPKGEQGVENIGDMRTFFM